MASMGKGSLLTKNTMIASVSRMQPDQTVPLGPGHLPNREKGNTGLGLFEFSREEALAVSLWLPMFEDIVCVPLFFSISFLKTSSLFWGKNLLPGP